MIWRERERERELEENVKKEGEREDDSERNKKMIEKLICLHPSLNKNGQHHYHHHHDQNKSFHNLFSHNTPPFFKLFLLFGCIVLNHNL
jgi:hypothetical protein